MCVCVCGQGIGGMGGMNLGESFDGEKYFDWGCCSERRNNDCVLVTEGSFVIVFQPTPPVHHSP